MAALYEVISTVRSVQVISCILIALYLDAGPLVYLSSLGQSVLILNTAEAAFDLLDRRGSNYSDRPRLIMAAEILAGGVHVGFVPDGHL